MQKSKKKKNCNMTGLNLMKVVNMRSLTKKSWVRIRSDKQFNFQKYPYRVQVEFLNDEKPLHRVKDPHASNLQTSRQDKKDNWRERREKMDRVFSVGEISDQYWSSQTAAAPPPPSRPPAMAADVGSKMNRSASEWAFQRFLQETSASPPHSSAPDHGEVIEIKDSALNQSQKLNANHDRISNCNSGSISTNAAPTTTADNGAAAPPNIPIDSEEYQAFLKSKLHLACAAVALKRVNFCLYLFLLLCFGGCRFLLCFVH